jgi:hypothetical protein
MAALLAFPQWAPDITSYKTDGSLLVQNVVPRGDGYGPFNGFNAMSAAIPAGNDSYTKVLLQMSGTDASTTFTDTNAGGSSHTWTAAADAQIDTAQSKFDGASGLFDGTGDYISTPDHADFTLGSGAFTVDLWLRPNVDGSQIFFAGQMDAAGIANSDTAWLMERSATNKLVFYLVSGTTPASVTSTTDIVAGAWYHIAVVRTDDVLRLFVNGTQEGGDVAFSGAVNDSSEPLVVGRGGSNVGQEWNGWIDEFRLSVGIARWTTTFTPPTGSYTVSAVCRGYFYARNTDGTVTIFAGTSTRLYKMSNTDFTWEDISKGSTSYAALPSSAHWQFAQFGSIVIAVQPNVAPQAFTLGSSTAFADLGGSPPQASYVSIVGRFVVLSGLTSTPYRVQWSALGSAVGWTAGTDSSDFQDLPDGGIVRGVAGGEYGVIFQETTMRRMIYSPGSTVVFQIERITEDKGLLAPYSIIRSGDRIFFLAAQGFYTIAGTGYPTPIGKERFDRTFFELYDSSNLQLVIGAADPEGTRVYWAFKTASGSMAGQFNRLLCYDYGIDRASLIVTDGEYIASLAAPGITLESMDSVSSSIDSLSASFDDISTAALAKLSAVNTSHVVGFYSGSTLEATIDTSEHGGDRRFRVRGFRPVTDAASCYGSVGKRETLQETVSYSTEQAVNALGVVPANVSTRLARGRLRIPAAAMWTYAAGIEPVLVQEGKR